MPDEREKMSQSLSFFDHLHHSLKNYRLRTALLFSFIFSLLFFVYSIGMSIRFNHKLCSSLTPYLLTLLESQDRPELLRILKSVAHENHAELLLIQNNTILISTRDISEMDTVYNPQENYSLYLHGTLLTRMDVQREGHASLGTLYLFTPIWPVLKTAIQVLFLSLVLCFLMAFSFSKRLRRSVQTTLLPLKQLQEEIQNLKDVHSNDSDPIAITELEEIRKTILETKTELEEAKNRLAHQKAQKISADSYKRLIHDLHNPVSALWRMLRILEDQQYDEPTKDEARNSIPKIADQILNQVSSAKKNLEPISKMG